jgi:hypothetical protein
MSLVKLDVHDGPDDFDDVPGLLCDCSHVERSPSESVISE